MILIDILKIWSGRGVPLGHLGVPPGPRHRKYVDFGFILGAFEATLELLWIPSVSLGTLKMRKSKKKVVPGGVLAHFLEKC